MGRAETLLSKGYFPSQLPPSFTTQHLAEKLPELRKRWKIQGKTQESERIPACRPELFSVARAGHRRRITSIINPVPQTFLVIFVENYWAEFLKHYRKSRFSASRPRFIRAGSRAAFIPSMRRLNERKILESAGFRYMLRTDVSRFFPTIYTHSIPWAFHSKAAAKRNRKVTKKYFGNLFDRLLRQGQDGQTIGLPIGPDTSHIIAEAISIAVDLLLKDRLKTWPAGFRYVDDYFLFFPSMDAAQKALAALSKALSDFELQINFEKTKISLVSDIVDDFWTYKLRKFNISKGGAKQCSDIHHFFELAKNLASNNSDENVMTYALKRVSSVLIRKENWTVFEAHLCHTVISYPNTLQTVAQILVTYKFHGYQLNYQRIQRTINSIVAEHAVLNHHSEVAWCLWMCKELDVTLEEANVDLVSVMQSSVCALLLMDLWESIPNARRFQKAPKDTFWRSIDRKEALNEEFWLMCYEAGIRKWGGFKDEHVSNVDYFKDLMDLGVHFYDPKIKPQLIFNIKQGTLEKFKVDYEKFFERDDAEEYLEYEDGDAGYDEVFFEDENNINLIDEDDNFKNQFNF